MPGVGGPVPGTHSVSTLTSQKSQNKYNQFYLAQQQLNLQRRQHQLRSGLQINQSGVAANIAANIAFGSNDNIQRHLAAQNTTPLVNLGDPFS